MKSKFLWWILGGLGVLFVLSSLAITSVEYNQFSAMPIVFPAGSQIAGVPVGGLDAPAASDRVREFYSLPLVLTINDDTIYADPGALGFQINIEDLVAAGTAQIEQGGFWDFLWGKTNPALPVEVPLTASVDKDQLRAYLETEIAPRYTLQGSPITPIPGTTNFSIGESGEHLLVESAVADIHVALLSPSTHQVTLQTGQGIQDSASFQMLKAFTRHNIDWIGFTGLVEIYLQSLESGQTLHFAVNAGEEIVPDVAFTAASTIKIPIMISVLRRTYEPTPDAVVTLFERMIAFSENPPADTLMSTYLDDVRGPLIVSEDLAALGMENTFLAGFFYLGAPLLQRFDTPANTRTDVFIDPDIYNQTVPSEAGRLLAAIYTCAQDGSGLLTETFPGEITQEECQLMIDILAANRIGLLIEAGLPPEGSAAHKHGWVQELDGQFRSMSDVAIVFTPGGDYVLNIFIYDSLRLDFDQGNRLIARLSQTVYNFFNLDQQAYWWFE